MTTSTTPLARIESRILLIRDQKVMVDADLADLYGVPTKRLNEQVKRNQERFPPDFMFQLTSAEKMQVVASCDHLARLKFSKSLPFVFTEHGAILGCLRCTCLRASSRNDHFKIARPDGHTARHAKTPYRLHHTGRPTLETKNNER